jgi:hypothetical protein
MSEIHPFTVAAAAKYYAAAREIPDRGICGINRGLFSAYLFHGITPDGYAGKYTYKTITEAHNALDAWDGTGDPPGNWYKKSPA